jgi:hypothetical protein
VLDVIDSGSQSSFVCTGDAAFGLLGVQPGVLPRNGDYGDVDVGKDVSGRALDYHRAHQENQQRQYDKGVGSI